MDEASPCCQSQRTADADASDPERCDLIDTQANVPDHEQVQRLWCNRLDERLDLCGILRTRSEEHISSRRGVRLQASNGFRQRIEMAHVIALRSCGQQHILARLVNCLSCGANALDGNRQL